MTEKYYIYNIEFIGNLTFNNYYGLNMRNTQQMFSLVRTLQIFKIHYVMNKDMSIKCFKEITYLYDYEENINEYKHIASIT